MSRGWTWIDENAERSDEEYERLSVVNDELARQWSALYDEEEQRRFRRQADAEDGFNDYDFEDEEDERRHRAQERIATARHDAQLAAIEGMLEENGARMMRPYEHWNEDERYMQYMECDRFGYSCD